MNIPPEFIAEALKLLPGSIGSLGSLRWIKESLFRSLVMFVVGCALARYGAASVHRWTTLDEGFCGFLLGLLGMLVIAKGVEAWTLLDLSGLMREKLRQLLGLPVKDA